MASYKQPCVQCNEMIERESSFCPKCGSRNPFGILCPFCLKIIQRGNAVCSSCGKELMVTCPFCSGKTFIGSDRCDSCGKSLMVLCDNKRCGQYQFFMVTKCTACGKQIKNKIKK